MQTLIDGLKVTNKKGAGFKKVFEFCFNPTVGVWIDHKGRRPALFIGALCNLVGSAAYLLFSSLGLRTPASTFACFAGGPSRCFEGHSS